MSENHETQKTTPENVSLEAKYVYRPLLSPEGATATKEKNESPNDPEESEEPKDSNDNLETKKPKEFQFLFSPPSTLLNTMAKRVVNGIQFDYEGNIVYARQSQLNNSIVPDEMNPKAGSQTSVQVATQTNDEDEEKSDIEIIKPPRLLNYQSRKDVLGVKRINEDTRLSRLTRLIRERFEEESGLESLTEDSNVNLLLNSKDFNTATEDSNLEDSDHEPMAIPEPRLNVQNLPVEPPRTEDPVGGGRGDVDNYDIGDWINDDARDLDFNDTSYLIFEEFFPRWISSLPIITLLFVLIQVLAFAFKGEMTHENVRINYDEIVEGKGKLWRIFVSHYFHFGYLHLFMSIAALYGAGSLIENKLKRKPIALIISLLGILSNCFYVALSPFLCCFNGDETHLSNTSYGFSSVNCGLRMILCYLYEPRYYQPSLLLGLFPVYLSSRWAPWVPILETLLHAIINPEFCIAGNVSGIAAGLLIAFILRAFPSKHIYSNAR